MKVPFLLLPPAVLITNCADVWRRNGDFYDNKDFGFIRGAFSNFMYSISNFNTYRNYSNNPFSVYNIYNFIAYRYKNSLAFCGSLYFVRPFRASCFFRLYRRAPKAFFSNWRVYIILSSNKLFSVIYS